MRPRRPPLPARLVPRPAARLRPHVPARLHPRRPDAPRPPALVRLRRLQALPARLRRPLRALVEGLRFRLPGWIRAPAAGRRGTWRRPNRRRRWPRPLDLAWCLREVVTTTVVLLALLATGAAAAADPPPVYIPPVDAPISDPFRAPPTPYGAGNRGLEYTTVPGTPVRASGAGTVVFAGSVAGSLHVTLSHADGLRTSYSFLATVEVVTGQRLRQGDRLGTTGARLHFGVRSGETYLDPMLLFAGGPVVVELLPTDPLGADRPAPSEPEALAGVVRERPRGAGRALSPFHVALRWLRERAAATVAASRFDTVGRGLDLVADLHDRLGSPPRCSAGPAPVRPASGARRIAITVGGLGSTSESAAIDDLRTGDLGYDADHVVRFSYLGGRTPWSRPEGALARIPARAYASPDTQGDVHDVALRLADLVEDVLAADPDATVDIYGHSLGGLVTRLALLELEDRGADLGRLGVVTTLGTPHRGADLATAIVAANTGPATDVTLDAAGDALDLGLDPDAVVVRQLAAGSDVVRRLWVEGVPAGVHLVSIAARGDLVSAAPRTVVAGATNVTVPVVGWEAHSSLVAADEATAEMARALAREPPGCESWSDVMADVLAGQAISALEGHVATGVSTPG
jgi:murein DD-endopeptidase MepM/ murein hydrolase activator NlpD